MKKLSVLALLLVMIPSTLAVLAEHHEAQMQTNLITQGYEFARIQGMNHNEQPVEVLHWHMNAELGPSFAFCELQPATIPSGPFEVDITIQCQTRSGFTTIYPTNAIAKIETFVSDAIPEQSFSLNKIWVETRPQVPTPFPISPIGHVIIETKMSTGGTMLFLGGMTAIVVMAILIIIASLRKQE